MWGKTTPSSIHPESAKGDSLASASSFPALVGENCLALSIMWHMYHGRDPSCIELKYYFRLRQQSDHSGVYFPFSSRDKVM